VQDSTEDVLDNTSKVRLPTSADKTTAIQLIDTDLDAPYRARARNNQPGFGALPERVPSGTRPTGQGPRGENRGISTAAELDPGTAGRDVPQPGAAARAKEYQYGGHDWRADIGLRLRRGAT